jgi:hypothetical protein
MRQRDLPVVIARGLEQVHGKAGLGSPCGRKSQT